MEFVCGGLIALLALREWVAHRERRAAEQDRRALLNRIQAPHLAAHQELPTGKLVRPIPVDDDVALNALRGVDDGS